MLHKAIFDNEMKKLFYLGITKVFSGYSSPVILISRKISKEKMQIKEVTRSLVTLYRRTPFLHNRTSSTGALNCTSL